MNVIVLGCGRVGATVSALLADNGHAVTIIDHRDSDAAKRLGPKFKGTVVSGLGFDKAVLEQAGIATAEAFVAASASDNANIVAARIASKIFRVPRVVARLYDPRQAEIYKRLGLMTISSTNWGAERIFELVTHSELDVRYSFGRGEVSLLTAEVPYALIGRTPLQLNVPGEINVIALTRADQAIIPLTGTVLKEGDILHLTVLSSAMQRVEQMLGIEKGV